jgi:hypothetical protein
MKEKFLPPIPGPKHAPPPSADPIDYFNLFFTQTLWNIFVLETNRYADFFSQGVTKL